MYTEIVESVREDSTVFAESIPHLLHQDLMFLWILENPPNNRPHSWRAPIETWRALVKLLLTGGLQITSETVIDPLKKYTSQFGIDEVHWLSLKNSPTRIGVLSHTVLVRPLPDLPEDDEAAIRRAANEKEDRASEGHFAELAIQILRQRTEMANPLKERLARILERELEPRRMSFPPKGVSVLIPFLNGIVWGSRTLEPIPLEPLEILTAGVGESAYVPVCSACNRPLTRAEGADSVEVTSNEVNVPCPHCEVNNALPLDRFFVWNRSRDEVIAWGKSGVTPVPSQGFPPDAQVERDEMWFEWNRSQVGGDAENRFLRMRFRDKSIKKVNIAAALFDKLLIGGRESSRTFNGLPVVYEWIDALKVAEISSAEFDSTGTTLTYKELRLHGLPEPIIKVFTNFSITKEDALSIGMYPDPARVPDCWRTYRIFLDGDARRNYSISSEARTVLPWLVETQSELAIEHFFAVTSCDDPKTGVTYFTRKASHSSRNGDPISIPLGIDFGTTNSIIYFHSAEEDMGAVLGDPCGHCVEPRTFGALAKWFTEHSSDDEKATIGDFLPSAKYGEKRADPFLIPTVLWSTGQTFLIRWSGEESPTTIAEVARSFKWDVGVDRSDRRKAFLRELILLALPIVLTRTLGSNSGEVEKITVKLGFAFPLAFSSDARRKTIELYEFLQSELRNCTGFQYEINSINESLACTKALQKDLNDSDTFLVADMGGGTTDVALFIGNTNAPEQIGSLKFAGEAYVDALVKKRPMDPQDLRDKVFRGECHLYHGGDAQANSMLRRFIALTVEFLRTMIEAHRSERANQNIFLVLAGNGWHLVEAFSERTRTVTASQVFSEHYERLLKNLGTAGVTISNDRGSLPSYKHLVAIGALQHASTGGVHELIAQGSTTEAKLPAGRRLVFRSTTQDQTIEWSDLVGAAVTLDVPSSDVLRRANLDIDFDQRPLLSEPWRSYLVSAFDVTSDRDLPKPDPRELASYIKQEIPSEPPALNRGALQIMIERYGAEWL